MPTESAPVLRVEGLTKRFGSVVACERVDLSLHPRRIHGILGENGAGKTTLMRMLVGLHTPDAGTIEIDGQPCEISNPVDAATHGIAMVHQHLSLVEPLTVWENVALGDNHRLDPAQTRDDVVRLGERYGLPVDPNAVVADLPIGLRQRVEILKSLRRDPRVLILDEPTAMLTPDEAHELFGAIKQLVEEGDRTVALVSHRLDEVIEATNDITVLRRGVVIERTASTDATADSLALAMIGTRPVALKVRTATASTGRVVLRISDAVVAGVEGQRQLDHLNLTLNAGEIVGMAGIENNGQHELIDVLSSLRSLDGGQIRLDNNEVETGSPGAMEAAGIAVIPADRRDSGVVLEMSVAENLALSDTPIAGRLGLIDLDAMRTSAEALIDEYGIDCVGPDAPMWSLSGGNQQRVVLARELCRNPKVLIAAYPTRGLDVGAVAFLNEQLLAAAARGLAVLLVSNETDELLTLATRIVVMFNGSVIGELTGDERDRTRLGLLLGGRTS